MRNITDVEIPLPPYPLNLAAILLCSLMRLSDAPVTSTQKAVAGSTSAKYKRPARRSWAAKAAMVASLALPFASLAIRVGWDLAGPPLA